jgi:putative DNA primase/helicase
VGIGTAASLPTFRIARLPTPLLRELLSRSARWLVPQSDEPAENALSRVPQWVVSGIAARRHWPGLRPLIAVVTTPVLRPDGTILAAPGFDTSTGLYLAPRESHVSIPEHPTQADARAAALTLLASVSHVPFTALGDRSAWLAMLLTPLARFAVGAASPLCILEEAPSSRWSEEVIADIAAIVASAPAAAIDADDLLPSLRHSVDALRANGESIARITNGSARTTTAWRRVHEALQRGRATSGLVWFSSTTRRIRDGELPRYALTARCEGGIVERHGDGEQPHDVNPSLHLVAALTILRAYQVAGCPDVGLPRWAGFERWSEVVRAAVVWSGLPDPVMMSATVPTPTNATEAAITDLVAGWSELARDFPGGCSTRQALDELSRAPTEEYPRLRAAVAVFAPGPLGDRSTADRLGRALTRFRDEQYEDQALVLVGSGNQGNRWAVRSMRPAS